MKCFSCGFELSDDSKFCTECGAVQPQIKLCPKCKKELALEVKFCSNCGYNFENASSLSSNGINMGDKNVVAGDIIGKNENYNVSGNATIIKNEDETRKLVRCHVCFKNLTIVNTHTCPICGEAVCDNCFDNASGMCVSCRDNNKTSGENEYKEALKKVYEDGRVDLSERRSLEALQDKLGLSEEKANELENEIRFCGSGNTDSFTTVEKLNMEDATELFYEKFEISKAYELMKTIYDQHQYDEKVLGLYLPILAEYDSDEALYIIQNLKADMLEAYLVQIDIYTKSDLSKAERILDTAERLWNDNLLLKCRRVNWFYKMYCDTKRDAFYQKINELVLTLPEANNKLERTWKVRVENIKNAKDKCIVLATKKKCHEQNIYWGYSNSSIFVNTIKELTVDSNGNGDFETIQEAIDYAREGTKIYIKGGTYNETFEFNKKITIIGDEDEIPIVCIDSGTICKINADVTLKNMKFMNTAPCESAEDDYGKSCMVEIYSDCTLENCELSDSFDTNLKICGDNINPKLTDCSIHGAIRNGITIEEKSKATIKSSDIFENGNNGISSFDSSAPSVNDCGIYNNKGGALSILDNATGSYSNCDLNGNIGVGIYVDGDANPTVENCEIHDNKDSGIWVTENATGNYSGCNIYNNEGEYSSIYVDGKASPTVENCGIYDNEKDGIHIRENATGTYSNCELNSNSGVGIYVDEEADPTIANCEIHDNEDSGIWVTGDATGNYSSCKIYNNAGEYSSIYVAGEAYPIVEKCKIHDNKSRGIYITENATGTYSNCDLYGNSKASIYVSGKANPIVKICKIHDNEFLGIVIKENATGTYSNCDLYGNSKASIGVFGKANPMVENCKIHDDKRFGIVIDAEGTYSNCDLYNSKVSIAVRGVNPMIENCKIHDNKDSGIWVTENANGTYKNCHFYNNDKKNILNTSLKSPVFYNNREG